MAEHGMIFQGWGVRAIQKGHKGQTRRTRGLDKVNTDPGAWYDPHEIRPGYWLFRWNRTGDRPNYDTATIRCPYGIPGDRLWVREKFAVAHSRKLREDDKEDLLFAASALQVDLEQPSIRWRPSIHMPRWACRLILEVKSIRVERVQRIGIYDIRAEGLDVEGYIAGYEVEHGNPAPGDDYLQFYDAARENFQELWDSINAKRGYSWSENPWCWVLDFQRIADANTR